MRVVVTRPAREAQGWVDALQARGHEVLALPLIEIVPLADDAAVRVVARDLGRWRAVMFVSANAVHGFAAAVDAWPPGVAAWATGPGTVAALRQAGVPADAIRAPGDQAAQFDSEALWAEVHGTVRPGDEVLLVRGAGEDGEPAGRDWLARTLQEAGVKVHVVAAYQRRRPQWTPPVRAQAAAAAQDAVWLFSSSEAVGNLRSLLPAQDWSQARALATHERIAEAARGLGFAVVRLSRPDMATVVRALESIG